MSQLYSAVKKIEEICSRKGLHPYRTKGQIALRVGFVLSFIDDQTPDNPSELRRLKAAALEVLGEPI